MTQDQLTELKRANDMKEREVMALERMASNTSHRTKNCLETVSDWWDKEKARSMRMNY